VLGASEWNVDQEDRPFSGPVIEPDRPLMILDDAIRDGETQASAGTDILRRKERVENALLEPRRYPRTGVLKCEMRDTWP
jgi:hypothetical protein